MIKGLVPNRKHPGKDIGPDRSDQAPQPRLTGAHLAEESRVLHINTEKLWRSHETFWFLVDIFMLILLLINIAWITFDALYQVELVHDFLKADLPGFVQIYQPIHRHFILVDLMFIAVFLTEFAVRWIRAIIHRTYYRWYFYPFLHWYDLVGCIPSGGYRFLRILRIISIVYRLDQYDIINFKSTRLGRFLSFYYEAFMEELSDRIVIKIISGAQDEIRHGSGLIHKVQTQVLMPRREEIRAWLSEKVRDTAHLGFHQRRGELRRYLESKVDGALRNNIEVQRLTQIPMFGSTIASTLESSVGDIVAQIIHQILDDLSTADRHVFVDDLVASLIQEAEEPDHPPTRKFLRWSTRFSTWSRRRWRSSAGVRTSARENPTGMSTI